MKLRWMWMAIALLVWAIPSYAAEKTAARAPACAAQAREQAHKLLVFHFGSDDDRIEIDSSVKRLPSIQNPAAKSQHFDVLEVWGYIYKGQYRMRFEYFRMPDGDCLLMGQEILEYARL